MKRFLVFLCTMVLFFGGVTSIGAVVLTFDDLTPLTPVTALGTIPDGYGGFDWDNFGYLNQTGSNPGSGYKAVSGDYVAFNEGGQLATVGDGLFSFDGAYFSAAWNQGLNITITGLAGDVERYSSTIVVDPTTPTWFDFSFADIDSLKFESSGGIDVVEGGAGVHFAMDNFTYTPTSVPEPSTVLLLGSGLVGLVVLRRRSKK
jgi:hypothetical protein